MLEAQPLHRVVQLDVDAEIVGIELQLVVAEAAGLVDVHDQIGDVAVGLDAPVAVARGIGLIVDGCHKRSLRGGRREAGPAVIVLMHYFAYR